MRNWKYSRAVQQKKLFLEELTSINHWQDLSKRKRERIHINKVMNERGEIMNTTKEIETIIRNYYHQIYVNKLSNLGEMDGFPETYKLPRLKQKEIDNLNRPRTSNKGINHTNSSEAVSRNENRRKLPNSFYEARNTLFCKSAKDSIKMRITDQYP